MKYSIKVFFILAIMIILTACFSITTPAEQTSPDLQPTGSTETATPTPAPTALPSETPTPNITPTRVSSPLPSPTSDQLGIGSKRTSGMDGMTQLYVPEGKFQMGSDTGYNAEKPMHPIWLDAYWIDQTEVTNAMYAKCVNTGACKPPKFNGSKTRKSYYGNPQYDDYPVINLLLLDYSAEIYCEWAGRRLPTEAEWEKASRGQDERPYPWGKDISCQKANFFGENGACTGDTTKVGSYPDGASPYGALDMAGNVWEYVSDFYYELYYNNSPIRNPQGPSTGINGIWYHSLRGGSWASDSHDSRTTVRSMGISSLMYASGFRCAMSAAP